MPRPAPRLNAVLQRDGPVPGETHQGDSMSYFRANAIAVSESAGCADFVIRLDAALARKARVN